MRVAVVVHPLQLMYNTLDTASPNGRRTIRQNHIEDALAFVRRIPSLVGHLGDGLIPSRNAFRLHSQEVRNCISSHLCIQRDHLLYVMYNGGKLEPSLL